jgi:N6-L-threonylcarbamoyladenine synthase
MKILSIESSCDETSVAIVEERNVLSNIISTQIAEHKIYGGVVPEIASRRHAEAISAVCDEAVKEAGITYGDVDAVAVTFAPGLIGALLVGVNFAKGLCFSLDKPLVPVHHIRSHIAANYLVSPDLEPPFLALVASGGHSLLIDVKDYTDYEILGKTLDDAAGEAFDKTARALGFPYPGGIYIDAAAKRGDPFKYRLPDPHTENPLDFSFSGLKTAVLNLINQYKMRGEEIDSYSLAASFQKTVCDILERKLSLAIDKTGRKKVVLAGGVAANSEIRERIEKFCKRNGLNFYMPTRELCTDNAAMVASQAYFEFKAGKIAGMDLNAYATMPADDVRF